MLRTIVPSTLQWWNLTTISCSNQYICKLFTLW